LTNNKLNQLTSRYDLNLCEIAGRALDIFVDGMKDAAKEPFGPAPTTKDPAPGTTPSTPGQGNPTFTISSANSSPQIASISTPYGKGWVV
jgi:hypothetical protein